MTNKVVDTSSGKWEIRARRVGGRSIDLLKAAADAGQTKQIDPVEDANRQVEYLQPDYDPLMLSQIREVSAALAKCIEAMKTNVFGFGWELERAKHIEKDDKLPPQAEEEEELLNRLFNFPNYEQSFIEIGQELNDDYESMGYGGIEVVRSRKGDIIELHPLPFFSMRLIPRDEAFTEIDQRIRIGDGSFYEQPRLVRFRRFVQLLQGQKKRFFKQFGDPRPISATDGGFAASEGDLATEVLYFRQGPSYAVYGLPRWISTFMDIVGSRKANQVNYEFFDNKGIPSYVLMISGGTVPDKTVAELREFMRAEIKGVDHFHDGLIIEAVPMDVGDVPGEKMVTPKIELKPLTQFIASDAQFLKYQEKGEERIVHAYRIPPIYWGGEKSYNFATALAAVRLAEQQVFKPERTKFEHRLNTTILTELEINYWSLRLKEPTVTDHVEMIKAMGVVKEGIPIGIIQEVVNDMRGDSREIPEELFNVTLADQNRQAMEARLSAMQDRTAGVPGAGEEEEPGSQVEKMVTSLIDLRKSLRSRLTGEGEK